MTSETTNSTLGLKLILSVNSTMIPSQDAISMNASILNTEPNVNNLTATDRFAIQGLSSGPCDPNHDADDLFSPVGFAVFRGSFGLNNLTSAGEPVQAWAAIECPVSNVFIGTQIFVLHNITSYALPLMTEANLGNAKENFSGYYVLPTGSTPQEFAKGVFPGEIEAEATIYAANGTGFYNSLDSSLPARYTLVAGDEWGQVVTLEFVVAPSSNLPRVGSFLASVGACAENLNPAPCETSDFSQAFIFNCAAEAATSTGCTTQVPSGLGDVGSPLTSYTITVWYPYADQPSEPGHANCMFSVKGDDIESPYGYCFLVNSTSFAMSFDLNQ